ncbi:lysylphosphatidylglycerol synthase domain-containing protein, partial [Streptomyces sp. NPDC000941]
MNAGALKARLGTIAGAVILGVVVWRVGTGAFLDGVRRIDAVTLLAALGLGLFTTVFSAWRWCLVARALGIRLPLGAAVADYYRALFLNAALPGGVLGDVHRAVRHGRDAGDVGRGVRAVVLERAAGQVVLAAVGVGILLTRPSMAVAEIRHLAGRLAATPGALAVLAAACALAAVAVVRLRGRPRTS